MNEDVLKKSKGNNLGVDHDGIQKTMRKRDYFGDMSGQLGLGLMMNITGQLTYFYTDKVGLSAAAIGACLLIAKLIDALTDTWAGNIIDKSRGGNEKYNKWMGTFMIPAAISILLIFTVPNTNNSSLAIAYVLITNILLSAIFYTFIATPYAALMVVRTKSNVERGYMGTARAAGNYLTGMILSITLIPITNMLGGDQKAWVKYGVAISIITFITFAICYFSSSRVNLNITKVDEEKVEDAVPFKEAIRLLFKNKYWVIVLVFNLLVAINFAIQQTSGPYYMKWIFGDDNLVGIIGGLNLIPTLLGFLLAGPIISKLGVKRTVRYSILFGIVATLVKCLFPTNFNINVGAGLIATFASIPLMSLFGVLTALTIDWNEIIYKKKMVATSGAAISFGNKMGTGIGTVLITVLLTLSSYNPHAVALTPAVRTAILVFSNWIPLFIFVILYFLFAQFNVEEKIAEARSQN